MNASNQNDPPAQDDVSRRVIELEMLFTHLQRNLAELDQVVLAQQRQIETLERTVERLRAELERMTSAAQEPRSLEDDKPPHY